MSYINCCFHSSQWPKPLVIQLLAQIQSNTAQLKVSLLIHVSFKFAHELRWRL